MIQSFAGWWAPEERAWVAGTGPAGPGDPHGNTQESSPKGETRQARRFPKAKDTKQQRLIAMLKRPDGATIAQMTKAFGWERHTVRGALSGALKKKLGLKVVSQKPEGGERVYRIA